MCDARRAGATGLAVLVMLVPALAAAHGAAHGEDHGAPGIDELVWDVATAAVLALAALGYVVGASRLRARGAAISPAGAAAYLLGLVLVAIAQLSPLDASSEIWFSAHMGQHELLVLFAAPLVVAGRPELVLRAALPPSARARLVGIVHAPGVIAVLRALTNRWFVVLLHGVVVWLWHLPVLFEAALRSESVHVIQHLTFFATSVLFWWAMIRGRYGRLGYGLAALFVFVTALHKGLLALLIALAGRAVYPTHVTRTAAAGGDPLGDQQLAGLLMWVPAGLIMAALGVAMFVAWLGAIERRASSGAIAATRTSPR